MSLSSIFEVYQLAHGPSLPYTTGALKTGQYFREVLIGVPYHPDNRIIVEFLGNFSQYGLNSLSHVALVGGLAGYIAGENRLSLKNLFERIEQSRSLMILNKSWGFSVGSDVVFSKSKKDIAHPNTIRFHVLGPNEKILLQAEYIVSFKGLVSGPGSRDAEPGSTLEQLDNFSQIMEVCSTQDLSLPAYVASAERIRHSISDEQIYEHLENTWQIMQASISNGLDNTGTLPDGQSRQAAMMHKSLNHQIRTWKSLGAEQLLVNVNVQAIAEEIVDNQLIITAPLCESAAILPGLLYMIQGKYSTSSKSICDGLLVGGLVAALLLKYQEQLYTKPILSSASTIGAAMAAAAGMFLIQPSMDMINQAANIAIKMSYERTSKESFTELPVMSIKAANLALNAINLAQSDYRVTDLAFDTYFKKLIEH